MLGAAVTIFLCLLASQVNGLITSAAKCLVGFEWMSSSINQSPCDVSEELLSVCLGRYPLPSLTGLPTQLTYNGPLQGLASSCFCNTVVYSLMSACAICQNHSIHWWSFFRTNCTTVSVAQYTPQIPDGVKVPAYAYLDVTASDIFNPSLAQSMRGPESSRLPSPSTASSFTPSSSSSTSNGGTIGLSSATAISSNSDTGSVNNTPAIIGGVVGGVVAIGLIGALITFLVLRLRRKPYFDSKFQKGPLTPNTTSSSVLPPGTPGKNANELNTYPYADPNMYLPYDRQHSLPLNQNVTQNSKENNAHNHPPQRVPQSTGVRVNYFGMPEV